MKQQFKFAGSILLTTLLAWSITACAAAPTSGASTSGLNSKSSTVGSAQTSSDSAAVADPQESSTQAAASTVPAASGSDGGAEQSEFFSQRDLEQSPDLSEAERLSVQDGTDITLRTEGVYILEGSAKNVTIYVEAGDEDKVQLVLQGLQVENDSFPVIYVKNADKVFVTTAADSENSLSVTGTFTADGSTNTDAVIFSRDDLVLNGLGTLTIRSTDNGISSKDGLKLTGGALTVQAQGHGLEANDTILLADGTISITAKQDGLHAENNDDSREGHIYIFGGTLTVNAGDDGLHAVSIVQIAGGSLNITAAEGIEGTWVQLNEGSVTIQASDDGINGTKKSTSYTTCVEINGGTLDITMGQGDTDA
ncbi:MAG: carbohydrate-binding domain-containing protein, partial [Oscillospiraceae bacterium]|nr:carbohydrate-binding domain-containing protein [Oscillospiraceae bacterium]